MGKVKEVILLYIIYFCYLRVKYLPSSQSRCLDKFLRKAFRDTDYYHDVIIQICGKNSKIWLDKIPFLTKEVIRKQDTRLFSNRIGKDKWCWLNTGGSTGEPLRFPFFRSRYSLQIEFVAQMYLYKKMGYSIGDRIAAVDGRRVDEFFLKKRIFWGYNPAVFPFGKIHYSTLYLDENTVSCYVDSLNTYRPSIIRGYPSGLVTLAKLIKLKKLSLSFQLKGIYLTSENFSSDYVEIVKEVFGCPIWGQYGHTESSVFAYSCPSQPEKYYCLPFYGKTELIRKDGTHCDIGEIGEIVVTGFSNQCLPFVRYRTGDLAEYGGTTKNGTVVLNKLMGRSVDVLYDCNKRKIYLVGFIFGGHIPAFDVIDNWQMEQSEYGKVILRIVRGEGFSQKDEANLVAIFYEQGLNLQIEYVSEIAKTHSGKQKFLIQNIV